MSFAKIVTGCALSVLRKAAPSMFHACVTSPPYYGLRDYKVEPTKWPAVSYSPMPGAPAVKVPAMTCALGLEPTPEAFVGHLVLIFREVRRVLRDDGTLWLNLGDSYASYGGHADKGTGTHRFRDWQIGNRTRVTNLASRAQATGVVKAKDLLGIPWRVAFALQADGWYLRQDVIWHKPNPMPESVTDRCTKAHEYVFLLTRSPKYYYDHVAVQEEAVSTAPSGNGFAGRQGGARGLPMSGGRGTEARWDPGTNGLGGGDRGTGASTRRFGADPVRRNKRSVWTVPTRPSGEAGHYATFNTDLVEPCIRAGTSEAGCCARCGAPHRRVVERVKVNARPSNPEAGALEGTGAHGAMGYDGNGMRFGEKYSTEHVTRGWEPACSCEAETAPCIVLDPFSGRATTGVEALYQGRAYVGIELNPKDARASQKRLSRIRPVTRVDEAGEVHEEAPAQAELL